MVRKRSTPFVLKRLSKSFLILSNSSMYLGMSFLNRKLVAILTKTIKYMEAKVNLEQPNGDFSISRKRLGVLCTPEGSSKMLGILPSAAVPATVYSGARLKSKFS